MRIGIDNALGIHTQALQLRGQRTEILARNIANADTPGYKSRDIDFKAALQSATSAQKSGVMNGGQIQRTHAHHLQDSVAQSGPAELRYRTPLMPSMDGNTVETQIEQAEFAENALQFQASLRFVDGRFKGMLTAIKGE